jgi:hypothetical protein
VNEPLWKKRCVKKRFSQMPRAKRVISVAEKKREREQEKTRSDPTQRALSCFVLGPGWLHRVEGGYLCLKKKKKRKKGKTRVEAER